MVRHLKSFHYNTNVTFIEFNTYDEFMSWKREEERKYFSYFKVSRGSVTKLTCKTSYFACVFNHAHRNYLRRTVRKRKYGLIPNDYFFFF
jgi:hypothetical protein